MRLRPTLLLFLALLGAVSPASTLHAQTTTSGGLTGVVTDQSNAVVPNAAVEIRDNGKGTTQATKSDREGVYRFFFLAPARYLLTVAHEGFRKQSGVVNVPLGPPVTVNVTLEVEEATTEITVTGEAPLIHAENGDASATLNRTQISEVPNPGNDLTYIVQTAPGVVMNTDIAGGAAFSILGMPGNSYLYTIDGMNDTDNIANLILAGDLNLALGQNQIQEATVVSTGYSGQFGGAAGGNINYATKSGSNEFHGNAQYYWNGRVLNANDWFNKALGNPRPFDIANQWAGSAGGTVKKDKLFFFFDTEGLRVLIPQVFFVTIPSPEFEAATMANLNSIANSSNARLTSASVAFYQNMFNLYNGAPGANRVFRGANPSDPTGCAGFTGLNGAPCARYFLSTRGRPNQDALTSGRLDWMLAKDDRIFFRLQYDGSRAADYTDPISSVFDVDVNEPFWQGQLVETHTFASSAASQFVLAGSYAAPIYQTKNPSQALSAFPTTLNFASGNFANLGGQDYFFAFGLGWPITQYQLSEDLTKVLGEHKFGIGANITPIWWDELASRSARTGQLTVQSLNAFYQGGVDPASPSTDFTSLAQSFTSQTTLPISFLNLGFYGQDEWRLRPNLALTFALRAEHYSNPVCRTRCFARLGRPFESISHDPGQPYDQAIVSNQKRALESTDNILWMPRLSFAWQPFGISRNSVVRGGYGIFYNPVSNYVLDSFSGSPPQLNSYTVFGDNLTPNEKTNLFDDAKASNAAFVNGFASGQTLAQIQQAISSFYPPGFSPPAVTDVSRTFHSPQFQRWSLEWEQGFGVSTSVSMGYFGHHDIHETEGNGSANAYGFGSLPSSQCTSSPVPPCADPRFSRVGQVKSDAVSNYNGLVLSFKHQFTRWTKGLFQANYSYGHAFDEVSNGGLYSFTSGSSLSPQDPNNLRGAYGPAEYDVRHSFNANYVWDIPVRAMFRRRVPNPLVKGWQISGTIFARTGFPYTVFDNVESGNLVHNNYFGQIYAVPAGPLPAGGSCGEGAAWTMPSHPCLPAQFSALANGTSVPNPNALFVQTSCETGFNAGHLGAAGVCNGAPVSFSQGRNRFRGPGYFNIDFAIMKNTRIHGWEDATLGIGFQFFNLFNHPNFGFPDNLSSDLGFGQIFYLEQSPTSILGAGRGGDAAPRMIQLKAQLQF